MRNANRRNKTQYTSGTRPASHLEAGIVKTLDPAALDADLDGHTAVVTHRVVERTSFCREPPQPFFLLFVSFLQRLQHRNFFYDPFFRHAAYVLDCGPTSVWFEQSGERKLNPFPKHEPSGLSRVIYCLHTSVCKGQTCFWHVHARPTWDGSCRTNLLIHPDTVFWHQADES